MNKYIIIILVLVVLVGGGIVYSKFIASDESKGIVTGEERNITITIKKNEWRFVPDVIEAVQGDKINLTVINEDEYDHGIAIEAFGVNQRVPAGGTINTSFVVTKAGEFIYYCSVPCGEGEVNGEHRGHFDQVGKLKVSSIVKQAE